MSLAHKIRFWQSQFDDYGFNATVITTSKEETQRAIDFLEHRQQLRWYYPIMDQLTARLQMYSLIGPGAADCYYNMFYNYGTVFTRGMHIVCVPRLDKISRSTWKAFYHDWRVGFSSRTNDTRRCHK